MTYKLFLDDERVPVDDDWVIVRDFAAAVNYVQKNGFPQFISFDNDLGTDIPTGYEFAKWLIERDLDHNDMPLDFGFYVHSQNPVGKRNIEELLYNYLNFRRNMLANRHTRL